MSSTFLPTGLAYARALQDLNLGMPVIVRAGSTLKLLLALERTHPHTLAALAALSTGSGGTVFCGRYTPEAGEHTVSLPFSLADDLRPLHRAAVDGEALPGAVIADDRVLTAARDLLRRAELLPFGWLSDAPPLAGHALSQVDLDATDDPRDQSNALYLGGAQLPLAGSAHNTLHAFRNEADGIDHYALVIGSDRPLPAGVPVRIHSECFTGDFLGSLKCDCGPQLQACVHRMINAGQGVLLYLRQEGRGIGLSNKIRAYALQDKGCDTVDANLRLGFGVEQRHFKIAADMLKHLNVSDITLLTNNPRKMHAIEQHGIVLRSREALQVGENTFNSDYLNTKRTRTGHLLQVIPRT